MKISRRDFLKTTALT
ncbi:twin-arginine translocation signal domain-containing protein, partial [Candidatus Pelagibacter communis]